MTRYYYVFTASRAIAIALALALGTAGCSPSAPAPQNPGNVSTNQNTPAQTPANAPTTAPAQIDPTLKSPDGPTPPGMVWIPGGEFLMGSNDPAAKPDEKPPHPVRVDGFWMDQTEVTNAQFRQFVQATGYVTVAEKAPKLEEIMAQLPPGTTPPKPQDLVPGSLVFTPTPGPVPLDDFSRWWRWQPGANWRHPEGPNSSIEGKDDHPVVQVAWEDAVTYARWAGKRLPSEAEWERAARGGRDAQTYVWGNQPVDDPICRANIWQGSFPFQNLGLDRFLASAPVKSFEPNAYGLFDMSGNVWEIVADWYRPDTYAARAALGTVAVNPQGPDKSHDPREPYTPKRVVRGGSFLCNDIYCTGYRPSARMTIPPDTGLNHTGFRCVMAPDQWKAKARQQASGTYPPSASAK